MFSQRHAKNRCSQVFSRKTHLRQILKLLLILLIFFSINSAIEAQNEKTRKQAEKAMRAGEFAAAEILWQKILQAEPENNSARLQLSYALYKQRRFAESYEKAIDILKTEPSNVRARSIIGAVYLAAGQFETSAEIIKIALAIDPDEPLALANSALLDFYNNRSRQSLIKLRRASFLEPREPDFIFARAQVAARTENYREAADAYTKFLNVAPLADADRRDRIQGLIDFLKYLGNQKSLYDVSGERQTAIACEIVNNRPVIKVRLNGRPEPLRFVIDTGSGMTVISAETAAAFGIKSIVEGGMARAVGGGGKFQIIYGFLNSLEIGGARISNVPIYIRKFNTNNDKFDGYIGLSVISKYLTTLDYGNKTLTLVRNVGNDSKDNKKDKTTVLTQPIIVATASSNALTVPLRITSSGFLSSEVKVEGVTEPLNFILDTGASISVVSAEAARRHEITRYSQATMMRVYGAAGVVENVTMLVLPRLELGRISREKISAAVLDLQPVNETSGFEQAGILGGNFLLHYRLIFDFQNARVTFEPHAKAVFNEGRTEVDDNLPD